MDITNPETIYIAVYDCVKPKLYRNDFTQLLCEVSGLTKQEIIAERSELNGSTPAIDAGLEKLASYCAAQIKNRNITLLKLKEFDRKDGLSGKTRHLCQESPIQQVYEYILVYALMPLFDAKLLYCQYGSIPGKGQIKGAKKIQRILNKDFRGKRVDCYKCDISKAYPSTKASFVLNLISKYCHKNKDIIYLAKTVMSNYPNDHLIIGGYFSTWAFNLVMSFIIRDLLSITKTRRGQKTRLINKIVCYADDFICFGYTSNIVRALKKAERIIKKKYGLSFKPQWQIVHFSDADVYSHSEREQNKFIDMMGFRIYRSRITVRKRIFKRLRRQYLRARRKQIRHSIPYWRGRKLIAYNSWIVYSKSNKLKFKYNIDNLNRKAINLISLQQKKELAQYERDL